ncbi:hypothetical protein [Streptomyces sp. CC208A]|uniref:hypothetical protein n=1 Tax=Streptomyces sp. CC208A TaxID=3044573 RepID=UPI0024A9731A|nr:hypothetical protein [Streptomyces sp. CC208A]
MATRTRRPRACTYCPRPDADTCVRTQRPEYGGGHIYAHRACAAERGVTPLYVFDTEAAGVGEAG